MSARRSRPTPIDEACAGYGAQPGRYCLPQPFRAGPYHADRRAAWLASLDTTGTAQPSAPADARPVVDVGELRRAFELVTRQHAALVERVLAAPSLADARLAAERARLALQPMPVTPPLEMDADLRARLARDSAALHDTTEIDR